MKVEAQTRFMPWMTMLALLSAVLVLMPLPRAFAAQNQEETVGCAVSPTKSYEDGFNEDDFERSSVFADENGDFYLDTAAKEIDPNRVIIPREQEVFATFIFEGAGYRSDFGYMILDEVVEKDADDNIVYKRVNDNITFLYEAYDPGEDEYFFRDANGELIEESDGSGTYKRASDSETIFYKAYIEADDEYYFRDRSGMTIEKYLGWDYVRQNNLQHPVFLKTNASNGGTILTADSHRGSEGNRPGNETDFKSWDDGSGIKFATNNDGAIDQKDMRKSLGTFPAGTELVFFLAADKPYNTSDTNRVYYTKKLWNPDNYGSNKDSNHNEGGCNYGGIDGMPRTPLVKRVADGTSFEYEAYESSEDEYYLRDENGDLIEESDGSNTYKRVSDNVSFQWTLYDSGDDEYFFRDDTGALIENVDDACHAVYDSYWEDWDPTLPPEDQWFKKVYEIGKSGGEKWTVDKNGWMTNNAINSLKNNFNVELEETDTYTLVMQKGERYEHVIVGAPADDPTQWILGWEDLNGGGDTDHNDVVFRIERKTGGSAELTLDNAIRADGHDPDDPNSPDEDLNVYYTGVTFEVWDVMPCDGKTFINYEVSIDGGRDGSWVAINNTDWDVVQCASLDNNGDIIMGQGVDDWQPGRSNPVCTQDSASPSPITYRSKRLDFSGMAMIGRELVWKASFRSEDENCVPEILNVNMAGSVARHAFFSRASPVVQANVLFSGTYETPDPTDNEWIQDPILRGHVIATRLYDPTSNNPTEVDTAKIWDAGQQLADMDVDNRTIFFPSATTTFVDGEDLVNANWSNPEDRVFIGKLADPPLAPGTLRIVIEVDNKPEVFTDKFTTDLTGDKDGIGSINRFTGDFELMLNSAPPANADIAAYASYVKMEIDGESDLETFQTGNDKITKDMLGLNHRYPNQPTDFDGDGDIDDDDKNLLVKWVRGYKKDGSTEKAWPLGPVDHSVPALQTPPGIPAWFYGTGITEEQKEAYMTFRGEVADDYDDAQPDTLQKRQTVLYVGARDGMLHAFDAGEFRWQQQGYDPGDNPETSLKEKRGYFLHDSLDDPNTDGAPQYGTGEELWAFVPASMMPKLKNNRLKKEDQAFVDASPTIVDVYTGDEWRTVVLSALGNGGDTIFCLDVTDPTSPKFMWEYANQALFRSRSSPSVAAVGQVVDGDGNASWAAFFVSGEVANDEYPSIFVIDIGTGNPMNIDGMTGPAIVLDSDPNGIGGVASGQPAMVDSDFNGYVDRLYIGTDKGNLYKVNLPDEPGGSGTITECVINGSFTDADGNVVTDANGDTVADSDKGHGIYGSPTVMVNNDFNLDGSIDYKVKVLFGTGDSPFADENINIGNTKYHFFAYVDQDAKGECTDAVLDWFFTMPAGERIWATAFASAGKIYFGSTTAETEDPCAGYQADADTGGIYAVDIAPEDPADATPISIDVGDNVSTSPVVYDEHVFAKKPSGEVDVVGDGEFNKDVKTKFTGASDNLLWREVTSY